MSNYFGQQPGYPPQNYQQGYNQQQQQQQQHQPPQGYGASSYDQQRPHGQPPPPPPQRFGPSPQFQQGSYGQPSTQHFGASPSPQPFGASSQPQQATYGHAAQPGYGQPPPHHAANYAPPAGQFSPTPASPGYDPRVKTHGNASVDADKLRKAMKGFGTEEKTLIKILSKPDPLQMALLRETYLRNHQRDLESDLESETSGNFKAAIRALAAGPLMQDVYMLEEAVKGMGTNESMLNDILLGRSNADMSAIKDTYRAMFGRELAADVNGDLSRKTAQLFRMILSGARTEDSAPITKEGVDADVLRLHNATGVSGDNITVCSILTSRSDGQLRSIAHQFKQTYQITLEKAIRDATTGHMEDALLLILGRATDRAMTDAIQIEEAMAGVGTKDKLLLNRIIRVHWNRAHMDQVKRAYQFKYKRDLITRVRGETSGDYEKTLVACLE